MDVYGRLGHGRLVDSCIGERDASWNVFRYGEVMETLFCNYYLEDINMLAPQLSLRPFPFMNKNTVFMLITACRYGIYAHRRGLNLTCFYLELT